MSTFNRLVTSTVENLPDGVDRHTARTKLGHGAISTFLRSRYLLLDILLVAVFSIPALLPLLAHGYLDAQDSMDPPWRSLELSLALSQGVLFPRWSPALFFGYGYPLFDFYSALPFYPAALLSAVASVGLTDGSKVAFGLYLLLSGVGAYLLGLQVVRQRAASLLAAVLYMYAPATVGTVYVRGSLATSAALAVLPFAMASVLRLCERPSLAMSVVAGAALALLVLAHNITAMVAFGMIALIVIWHFWVERDVRSLHFVTLAVLLGVGISAFYWIPALSEVKYTHLENLVPGGIDFRHNFVNPVGDVDPRILSTYGDKVLITRWGPIDLHLAYPYGAPPYKMGLFQGLLLLVSVGTLALSRKRPSHVVSLLVVTLLLIYMHFGWSQWIWELIPALGLIQHPWRLVGPLGVSLAVVVSWSLARLAAGWRQRLLMTAVGFVFAISSVWMLPTVMKPFDGGVDITQATLAQWEIQNVNRIGTVVGQQFLPQSVDWDKAGLGFRDVMDRYSRSFPPKSFVADTASVPPDSKAWILAARKGIEWMDARVETGQPTWVAFHTIYFPGWTAYIDGQKVPINYSTWYQYEEGRRAALGVCLVQVPAGSHLVRLALEDTPVRTFSSVLSLLSCLTMAALLSLSWLRGGAGRLSTARRVGPVLILLAVVFAGYIAWLNLAVSRVPGWSAQPVVRDFLTEAASHKLKLVAPAGSRAEDYVQAKSFTIGGITKSVLYMHPTSSASTRVWLPERAKVKFSLGIDPAVWDKAGDGVEFEVLVRDGTREVTVFKQYVNPKSDPSDRKWITASADLSDFAYKEVEVELATFPGASDDFDWAGWADPRIVVP